MDSVKRRPCADCGKTFPASAMEFHHVHGEKAFNIAQKADWAGGTGIRRVIREIAKCLILCSVCHAIRTHELTTSGGRSTTIGGQSV